MEYVFEFLLEFILEGSIEASKNDKIPRFIRYLLMIMLSLFFIGVIGLVFFTGILMLKENYIAGICFIAIGSFMLVMTMIKFRKTYLKR